MTAAVARVVDAFGMTGRHVDRRRMQRAARIFSGKTNWLDKWSQIEDKKWWALILLGVGMVGAAVLFAVQIALGWVF